MKKNLLLKLIALVALVTVLGCERRSREPNIELIQDMMDSPAVKAQDDSKDSMRLPPEGTIAQGAESYRIPTAEEAAVKLRNPFEKNAESLQKGQKLFVTYCSVCHGIKGDGKGTIAEKWPAPIPNFRTTRVREWKDGHIYHLITVGRGLMSSYASQVRPEERWHIINYIRHLQENSSVLPDTGAAN